MKKITIVGIGFVGLSNGLILSKNNIVQMLDVDQNKIDCINKRISPIEDSLANEFLKDEKLNISATNDKNDAYSNSDYIIISVPTDYNPETNYFNTKLIELVIKDIIEINPTAMVVIKSTIPIGYVNKLKSKFNFDNIMFSPEFLREGTAVYDNLYPSRIIVGEDSERARIFANILAEASNIKDTVEILYMNNTEAEAVKLFSNSYLAMRVAYINELDMYCEINNLNTKDVLLGMGADKRIGSHYNNPSFGYGAICFPKDTKQLRANFSNIPNALVSAIVESNQIRKDFITNQIINTNSDVIGIYRLIAKHCSDNFRSSAIIDVIKNLKSVGKDVIIYEPILSEETEFDGCTICNNLTEFKSKCDIILANRIDDDIKDIKEKVYTRDIFTSDI